MVATVPPPPPFDTRVCVFLEIFSLSKFARLNPSPLSCPVWMSSQSVTPYPGPNLQTIINAGFQFGEGEGGSKALIGGASSSLSLLWVISSFASWSGSVSCIPEDIEVGEISFSPKLRTRIRRGLVENKLRNDAMHQIFVLCHCSLVAS